MWFSSIQSALWLDETISYWEISGGFGQIWGRQDVSFPAYFYILWATKALFGSSEAVLRIPSVLAMLGATYMESPKATVTAELAATALSLR